MKVSIPALKNIRNTAEDEAESLENYLTNLYRDTEYKVKDKAYVENTDPAAVDEYRQRADILVNKLVQLSGLPEFIKLRQHFTEDISPGEKRNIVHDIKETCEKMCYRISKLNDLGIPVPERFKSDIKDATIDLCESGALTNLQIILSILDDSLYSQKYAFMQKVATKYTEEYKLYTDTREVVHEVNGLIHGLSKTFGVSIPRDVYVSSNPSENEIRIREQFSTYLQDFLSKREGVYSFVKFLAEHYVSKLPDNTKDGIKVKDKDGKYDSAAFEQIKLFCNMLKMSMHDLCTFSGDYTKIYYKEDYEKNNSSSCYG